MTAERMGALLERGHGGAHEAVPLDDFHGIGELEYDDHDLVVALRDNGLCAVLIAECVSWGGDGPPGYEPLLMAEGPAFEGARHVQFAQSGYAHYLTPRMLRRVADVLEREFGYEAHER